MDTRAKLKNYIAEHCVSHADDVLLTSGKTSQIYFDLRGLALDAQSAPWRRAPLAVSWGLAPLDPSHPLAHRFSFRFSS